MLNKILVIIPTFNEADNISHLIEEIFIESPQVHILVVDDNSPDGTAQKVRGLSAHQEGKVHLLLRPGKQGLGRAYVAGFCWGLEKGYEIFIEMDADFSHRPKDLPLLLEKLAHYDYVVGSRWIEGGGTLNWNWLRKLISVGGSIYSRFILGYPLRDWTGGFNGWKAQVLRAVNIGEVHSEGYTFQIELKYRASCLGFRGCEVPIVFDERREGQSKMSGKIVLEALYRVWWLRLKTKKKKSF